MKKIISLFFCISLLAPLQSFSSHLKDSTLLKHEFSVSYNRTDFGCTSLNYSRRLTQKTWLKFGLELSVNALSNRPIINTSYPTVNLSSTTTFLIGVENHKTIKSNFELISGLNLRLNTEISYSRIDNPSLPVKRVGVEFRNTIFSFVWQSNVIL
ncbi:MAG: hypothetical protein PHE33_03300 [Bacteroidales bacterium]|nr:hypothetical protein [Bacteroidales bacterium]